MTVTVYQSTDASAPVYNGAVGSLIALLNACLVNGYGAKAAAGWSKVFSGTNLASYRPPSGNRMYLGVDDTTTTNARVRAFETATAAGVALASGSGPFPTDALLSGGGYFYKGADTTTPRAWTLLATPTVFYFVVITSSGYPAGYFFGDIPSYKAGDAYNTAFVCGVNASDYATLGVMTTGRASTSGGHYLARPYTQLGGAIQFGACVDATRSPSYMGGGGVAYPSPIEGALLMAPVPIQETAGVRGTFPGIWNPLHSAPLSDGDTFTGTGDLAGKTFLAKNIGTAPGQVFFEISDTW